MKEYLDKLRALLIANNVFDSENIFLRYEMQVNKFLNDGLTEDEIISILGTPEKIVEIEINKNKSSTKKNFDIKELFYFSAISIFMLIFMIFLYICLSSILVPFLAIISNNLHIAILSVVASFLAIILTAGIVAWEIKILIRSRRLKDE